MEKIITKRKIFVFFTFLFLLTRFVNLTTFPIFTDEAIYIYWAKFIATHDSNWFMSLTDGKPPLFIWTMAVFLKLFPSSLYLIAGRLVSILAGGITLIGVYKLSMLLFNSKKTAYISLLLTILSPFMLLYDRLALFDSFLSAMLVWSIYYALKTSQSYNIKDASLWGLFLGLALLVKPTAIIFLLLTPVCFFIFSQKRNVRKTVLTVGCSIVIAEVLNSIQRLSVNYELAQIKNQQFQIPLSIFISNPFVVVEKNVPEIANWILSYYTPFFLIIGIVGFIFLLRRSFKKGIILLLLWLIPILGFAFLGKIIFPRYVVFTTPYFIIASSYFLTTILESKYRLIRFILVIFAFAPLMHFDYLLIKNPQNAPLPSSDYYQYISGEYSGYGLDTVFTFLDKELDHGPHITLVTQGKFGLFPYAFQLKYWDDTRMNIAASWIGNKTEFNLHEMAKSSKVYVVFWEYEDIPKTLPLRLVLRAKKPGNQHSIQLATLKE